MIFVNCVDEVDAAMVAIMQQAAEFGYKACERGENIEHMKVDLLHHLSRERSCKCQSVDECHEAADCQMRLGANGE